MKVNPVKSIAGRVLDIYKLDPSRVFSRSEVMAQFDSGKDRVAAAQAVLALKKRGLTKKVSPAMYQLVVKDGQELASKTEGKRGYIRKPVVVGSVSDAIIYLKHAKGTIADKESVTYMLVSLALHTLQGKL